MSQMKKTPQKGWVVKLKSSLSSRVKQQKQKIKDKGKKMRKRVLRAHLTRKRKQRGRYCYINNS